MNDPLGLITNASSPHWGSGAKPAGVQDAQGPDFKAMLQDQIDHVNALQADAQKATEDWVTGRRTDVENVIAATQKADTAFRMLLAVRNKVMDAYEEVKQIRV